MNVLEEYFMLIELYHENVEALCAAGSQFSVPTASEMPDSSWWVGFMGAKSHHSLDEAPRCTTVEACSGCCLGSAFGEPKGCDGLSKH